MKAGGQSARHVGIPMDTWSTETEGESRAGDGAGWGLGVLTKIAREVVERL